MIPARFSRSELGLPVVYEFAGEPVTSWHTPFFLTPITCIFIHGSWLHFIFNMVFLKAFGTNVEDRFGHFGYLVFFLTCGVIASATNILTRPDSIIPSVGASGAIAGVMAAYWVLYPRSKVMTLIPLLPLAVHFVALSAGVFIGLWLAYQLLQGVLSFSSMETKGVGWFEHLSGFAIGVFASVALVVSKFAKPPVERLSKMESRATTYWLFPRRG